MIIGCYCKPYTTELDGKPFEVKGERLVGKFVRKDKIYFRGVVFDDDDASCGDTVVLTKKEFEERVERCVEILGQPEKFDCNYFQTWKNGGLMNQKEVDSFAEGLNREPEETAFRAGFLVGLYKQRTDE